MLDTLKLQQMQCLGKHDDGGDGGFNCDGNGDGDDHDDRDDSDDILPNVLVAIQHSPSFLTLIQIPKLDGFDEGSLNEMTHTNTTQMPSII